jgi:hypothetical protein
MATTTNYSWSTPDDTALVKDGAAAIRTLGSSADTTVKALNPGTTAGDIDYYTTSTAKARVAIGTAGQVLQVNSGATAPEWATPSSGSMTSLASGTLSGASVVISAISGSYRTLRLIITNRVHANANQAAAIRLNGDSGTNYFSTTTYGTITDAGITTPNSTFIRTAGDCQNSGTSFSVEIIEIPEYTNTSIYRLIQTKSYLSATTASIRDAQGFYKSATAITSITILAESGNLTSGNYVLYGVK